MKDKEDGKKRLPQSSWKDHNNFTTLDQVKSKINNRSFWGFHLSSSLFVRGLSVVFCQCLYFFQSSHSVGCFSVRWQICLDWTWEWCCKGWDATSLPQFSDLNVSSFSQIHNHQSCIQGQPCCVCSAWSVNSPTLNLLRILANIFVLYRV